VSVIALGTMLYLASAGDAEAREMAMLVARSGLGRLSANYHDALAPLVASDSASKAQMAYGHLENALRHATWREREAILSTLAYATTPAGIARVKAAAGPLDGLSAVLKADGARHFAEMARALGFKAGPTDASEAERAMARVVPVRSPDFICPLDGSYLDAKLGPGALAGVRLRGNEPYETLNFVDNTRSVTDIARALSAELGPVAVEDVHAYLQILERAGLLALTARPGTGGTFR
jgi:hypothetical protein